jgi:hypothetical protein
MSDRPTSLLDRAARRAASALRRRNAERPEHSSLPAQRDRVTRAALLAGGVRDVVGSPPNLPPLDQSSPPAEYSLSRRETLKRGAATAGVLAMAGTLATARPASAGGQTLNQCIAVCQASHPSNIVNAIDRCGLGMRRVLGGFHSFILGGATVAYFATNGLCIVGVLAREAYARDQCIARCVDDCSPGGPTATCAARLTPVSGAGIAPPPQTWVPTGCQCVDGDTCCACPKCGPDSPGLCCIYGDCRCVPK